MQQSVAANKESNVSIRGTMDAPLQEKFKFLNEEGDYFLVTLFFPTMDLVFSITNSKIYKRIHK
jgi:hypothetical protein